MIMMIMTMMITKAIRGGGRNCGLREQSEIGGVGVVAAFLLDL